MTHVERTIPLRSWLVLVALFGLAASSGCATKVYFSGRVYAQTGPSTDQPVPNVYVIVAGQSLETQKALTALPVMELPSDIKKRLSDDGYDDYVPLLKTKEDGTFATPPLPPGDYKIGFYGNNTIQNSTPRLFALGKQPMTIQQPVSLRSAIQGRVEDARSHEPVQHPLIEFQFKNQVTGEFEVYTKDVSPTGDFAFRGITEERTYRIRVSLGGYPDAYYPSEEGTTLELGKFLENVVIPLEPVQEERTKGPIDTPLVEEPTKVSP